MIYIIIATIFYTISILFITAASRNLNSNLSAAIINLIGAVVPFIVAVPLLAKKPFQHHGFGLLMAICAGICIGIFAMASTKSYSLNKVGVVAPVIFGGAIALSSLLSTVIFKEKISLLEGVGLAILVIGFSIIVYARATAR